MIDAYAKALRLTFGSTILIAVVVFAMIVPTSIPLLQKQSAKDAVERHDDDE